MNAKRLTNSVGFKPQLNKVKPPARHEFLKGNFSSKLEKNRAQTRRGEFDIDRMIT
jgi:hypothetical protein